MIDRTYEEDVARRAYDLFLSRGGQHGHDVDDWLEAERQLTPVPTQATRRVASAPRATVAKSRRRSTA